MNFFSVTRYFLSSTKILYFSHKTTIPIQKTPGAYFLSSTTDIKKTSFFERLKKYWQDLITDYTEVIKETVEDGRKSPRKFMLLFFCTTFACVCFKTNPDDINYRENLIKCSNEILLVGKPIRNRNADQFLTSVETFYNFSVIRRLSLGLFSVMWIDNYSNELGIYKANCSYLKPQYSTFLNQIIDVGFLGKWWRLDNVMRDYDINVEEWLEDSNKGN